MNPMISDFYQLIVSICSRVRRLVPVQLEASDSEKSTFRTKQLFRTVTFPNVLKLKIASEQSSKSFSMQFLILLLTVQTEIVTVWLLVWMLQRCLMI